MHRGGFSIAHAIDCKKGSLVTKLHNKLQGGVSGLDIKAFTPLRVHDNPLIYIGLSMQSVKYHLDGQKISYIPSLNNPPVLKEGYAGKCALLIRDLWQKVTDSIQDMRVINTDVFYYLQSSP